MAPQSSLLTIVDPPSLGPPNPAYGEIIVVPVSDTVQMITISGQAPIKPDGTTPEGFAAQIELCLSRVTTCLQAVDATVHDVTRFIYYVTEPAWEEKNALDVLKEIVMPWLEGHRPASCFMVVKSLSEPQFLCEFEAQAFVRKAS